MRGTSQWSVNVIGRRMGAWGQGCSKKEPPLDLAGVCHDAACRPGARDAQPVSGGFAVSRCRPGARDAQPVSGGFAVSRRRPGARDAQPVSGGFAVSRCRPGARDAQPVSGGFAVSPFTAEAPAGPVRTAGSSAPITRKKKQPWLGDRASRDRVGRRNDPWSVCRIWLRENARRQAGYRRHAKQCRGRRRRPCHPQGRRAICAAEGRGRGPSTPFSLPAVRRRLGRISAPTSSGCRGRRQSRTRPSGRRPAARWLRRCG